LQVFLYSSIVSAIGNVVDFMVCTPEFVVPVPHRDSHFYFSLALSRIGIAIFNFHWLFHASGQPFQFSLGIKSFISAIFHRLSRSKSIISGLSEHD